MSQLPYKNIRIIERTETLTGRLLGQLFADQGAEVIVALETQHDSTLDNDYFNRNKRLIAAEDIPQSHDADILIVDGDRKIDRKKHQIVVRITAALPGDAIYGHLTPNCSEDLLNALVGFYTNMDSGAQIMGRPVIYTPLPLCSVYAAVNGAIAAGAALIERHNSGHGRVVNVSRLAGGLSAVGVLSMTTKGEPEHLTPVEIGKPPGGIFTPLLVPIVKKICNYPSAQLWLSHRIVPMGTPYLAKDKRFVLPMAAPNRRSSVRLLKHFGLWDKMKKAGMVDVSSFDPKNFKYANNNAADSMALNIKLRAKLAALLEKKFQEKTANQWEEELCALGIPCVEINSWEEWQNDSKAHEAKLFCEVEGLKGMQIGRAVWLESAQPYPVMKKAERINELEERSEPVFLNKKSNKLPLKGYFIIDVTNVLAGPSCARMYAELGATVYRIEPMTPQHSPTISVSWAAESGGGKKTIILNINTPDGKKIINQLLAKADMMIANKLDNQLKRLGLDRTSLSVINANIIGLQLSAHAGEHAGAHRDDFPGYDPAIQGLTGIMERFGRKGCPSFHGVASCVDYLCGCLGAWAGISALNGRLNNNKKGDWAMTSLAAAATLTQLLLQNKTLPISAVGPFATGMNNAERIYKLKDGWIFAEGKDDLIASIKGLTTKEAIRTLQNKNINAVPIQDCKTLTNIHRETPSKTIRFEKRMADGWETECFAPTWFTYNGETVKSSQPSERIGTSGKSILSELGYSSHQIRKLIDDEVVGNVEWSPN